MSEYVPKMPESDDPQPGIDQLARRQPADRRPALEAELLGGLVLGPGRSGHAEEPAPSPVAVDVPQLAHEHRAEGGERSGLGLGVGAVRAERRQLLEEVGQVDGDDAAGSDLGAVVAGLVDVAGEQAGEQRGRVPPHVEAGVVLDHLEPGEGDLLPLVVGEPEPIAHLRAALVVDEQVEHGPLHRAPAAERGALDPPVGGGRVIGIGDEAVDVVDPDREVEHQGVAVVPAGPVPLVESDVGEGHEALHLLGELERGDRLRGLDLGLCGVLGPRRGRSDGADVDREPGRVEDALAHPVGERGDRERRVASNRTGHHRAVGHVEPGMVEHLAARVDHAALGVDGHRACRRAGAR